MSRHSEDAAADAPRADESADSTDATARDADELLDVDDAERGSPPDLFRRLMTVGFSSLFTTESAIRGALGDTLPREWIEFFAAQSDRTRDEFVGRLATEFVRVLENVDVAELAEQLLAGRSIEVNAQFRLGPRDDDRTETPDDESGSSAVSSAISSARRKEERS